MCQAFATTSETMAAASLGMSAASAMKHRRGVRHARKASNTIAFTDFCSPSAASVLTGSHFAVVAARSSTEKLTNMMILMI